MDSSPEETQLDLHLPSPSPALAAFMKSLYDFFPENLENSGFDCLVGVITPGRATLLAIGYSISWGLPRGVFTEAVKSWESLEGAPPIFGHWCGSIGFTEDGQRFYCVDISMQNEIEYLGFRKARILFGVNNWMQADVLKMDDAPNFPPWQ